MGKKRPKLTRSWQDLFQKGLDQDNCDNDSFAYGFKEGYELAIKELKTKTE